MENKDRENTGTSNQIKQNKMDEIKVNYLKYKEINRKERISISKAMQYNMATKQNCVN
jgi:hypothetical protein